MGYYTNFSLNLTKADKSTIESYLKDSIKQDLSEISGYTWFNDFYYSDIKWCNYHKNMLELSKKYPYVIFRLIVDGEKRKEPCCIYYNNGMFQKAVIEEFNVEKLIESV